MTAEPHPQPDPLFLVTESELWEIYLTDAEGIIKIREVLSRPAHQQSEQEIRKDEREKVLNLIREWKRKHGYWFYLNHENGEQRYHFDPGAFDHFIKELRKGEQR